VWLGVMAALLVKSPQCWNMSRGGGAKSTVGIRKMGLNAGFFFFNLFCFEGLFILFICASLTQ